MCCGCHGTLLTLDVASGYSQIYILVELDFSIDSFTKLVFFPLAAHNARIASAPKPDRLRAASRRMGVKGSSGSQRAVWSFVRLSFRVYLGRSQYSFLS